MQQADQETQISSPHSETVSFNCVILIETFFFPPPDRPPPPKKKCKPSFQAGSLSFCSQPRAIMFNNFTSQSLSLFWSRGQI